MSNNSNSNGNCSELIDHWHATDTAIKEMQAARLSLIEEVLRRAMSDEEKTYYDGLAAGIEAAQDVEQKLKEQIKALVEVEQCTVKGATSSAMAVYAKVSTWDNKGLRGYSVAHPEVLSFCEINGRVTIRSK